VSLQAVDVLQINTVNGRTYASLGLNKNGSVMIPWIVSRLQ